MEEEFERSAVSRWFVLFLCCCLERFVFNTSSCGKMCVQGQKEEAYVSAVRHRRLLRMMVNVAASGHEGSDNELERHIQSLGQRQRVKNTQTHKCMHKQHKVQYNAQIDSVTIRCLCLRLCAKPRN